MSVSNNPKSRWFITYRESAAPRLRLFCIPHAGGSPSTFFPWTRELPADVDIRAVQLPGRGARMREANLTSIASIVDELAPAIAPYLDGTPYMLFCHSMGTVVGFELMRRLRRGGLPLPARAFLSGYHALHLPSRRADVHDKPDEALIAEIQRLGGTPAEALAHPELMALALPVLRADFTALETYVHTPEPPLPVPISAIRGVDDPDVNENELQAWAAHTSADFEAIRFPGDHFYLVPNQSELLRFLGSRL